MSPSGFCLLRHWGSHRPVRRDSGLPRTTVDRSPYRNSGGCPVRDSPPRTDGCTIQPALSVLPLPAVRRTLPECGVPDICRADRGNADTGCHFSGDAGHGRCARAGRYRSSVRSGRRRAGSGASALVKPHGSRRCASARQPITPPQGVIGRRALQVSPPLPVAGLTWSFTVSRSRRPFPHRSTVGAGRPGSLPTRLHPPRRFSECQSGARTSSASTSSAAPGDSLSADRNDVSRNRERRHPESGPHPSPGPRLAGRRSRARRCRRPVHQCRGGAPRERRHVRTRPGEDRGARHRTLPTQRVMHIRWPLPRSASSSGISQRKPLTRRALRVQQGL
jgi:hypothetical protein